MAICSPVPFDDYLDSVAAQTIATEHPKEADLRRAFSDLLISDEIFAMLGPAINSGRGMFLYGFPGNGKTSIAERITRCFGSTVWIPKVLCVEGQIIKLFDMANHEPIEVEAAPAACSTISDYDRRWVHIRRPTIVAGGELRMEDLEIHYDPATKVSEAPLQLKSNLGTFLIDDFGRQRMQPVELLNRWIVPLEKRYDFLSLANGKKIRVPFDQLILFSTNLEPKQPGRRGLPPPHPVQDPRDGPDRADVPPDDRDLRAQAGIPGDRPATRSITDRAPLPGRSADRSAAASPAISCSRSATTASTMTCRWSSSPNTSTSPRGITSRSCRTKKRRMEPRIARMENHSTLDVLSSSVLSVKSVVQSSSFSRSP